MPITLRGLSITDVNSKYILWLNNEEVTKYFGATKIWAHTHESIIEYVESMQSNGCIRFFAICKDKIHIGNAKIDIDWWHRVATLSLFIGDINSWGKGYGTKTVKLLVDFAFIKLNMHKCQAGVLEGNIASQNIFRKNGFIFEGERKQSKFNEGQYVDEILLGLINE